VFTGTDLTRRCPLRAILDFMVRCDLADFLDVSLLLLLEADPSERTVLLVAPLSFSKTALRKSGSPKSSESCLRKCAAPSRKAWLVFFHRLAISNVRPETRLWILVQEASCWFHRPNRLHNGTRNCHFLLLGAGYVQLCKKSTYQTNKKLG